MPGKIPRFASALMGRLIPTKSLFGLSVPVFQPFYHVVSNEKLPHVFNYPYRSVKQFKEELEIILKFFNPVSLEELASEKVQGKNPFHLSFDDGLKECTEIIAPVLLKKGIPATFFVNTGFVGNKALFHKYKASLIYEKLKEGNFSEAEVFLKGKGILPEKILKATILQGNILNETAEMLGIDFGKFLEEEKPYLTTNQLLQLKNQGFSVGAHSINHPEFWLIPEQEQIQQVEKSLRWVKENIQPAISAFAFPFTDSGVSREVFKVLEDKSLCDISFGTAGLKYDEFKFHLQRFPAETNEPFLQKLKEEFVYYKLRKLVGKARVKH